MRPPSRARVEGPLLVVSDGRGRVFEIPGIAMMGASLDSFRKPDPEELIEVPYGSDLFELPGRTPVGWDLKNDRPIQVPVYQGKPVVAVAAFMAPAHVQCLRSAYVTEPGSQPLSLHSFTAVGWTRGRFFAAGMRIDPDTRQDPEGWDLRKIERGSRETLKRFPDNRLVRHLVEHCVRRYQCPAARNFVLGRYECPIPTSPACNADCVGCISRQPRDSGVCASQHRILFVPTAEEIVEFTVPHLEEAERAVVSFGQGCEGEPLMVAPVLEEAIRGIRERTNRGVINLNTNASRPEWIERLFEAGLDSIRVSLNSCQASLYHAYYRPKDYGFEDVVRSLCIARDKGRWASINYFIFPGLTDSQPEMSALDALIEETRLKMIQARNLNMDPERYADLLRLHGACSAPVGIPQWVARIRSRFPWMTFGYFNPPREGMVPSNAS